jgi:phosphoglycolate phosphatase-like HAD superfamily hydrolase
LLEDYGNICQRDLLSCSLIPGIEDFLKTTVIAKPAFVVTGGNQAEVRSIFEQRGLSDYFQLILGSPTSKHDNMKTFQSQGVFTGSGVYFGDARLDKELAEQFGQDFIYISAVSEWAEGPAQCDDCMVTDFTAF